MDVVVIIVCSLVSAAVAGFVSHVFTYCSAYDEGRQFEREVAVMAGAAKWVPNKVGKPIIQYQRGPE